MSVTISCRIRSILLLAAMFLGVTRALADYTTNAVPYTNTWDSTANLNLYAATNLPGWNAGANDTSYITNMTYTHPVSQPFTPAQNQVLCLNTADSILTNNISSKLSASEPVIFDSVMNFQTSASTPSILTAGGTNDIGIKFSIFVDANTNLNIYHGWLNGSAGNWASNGITVITNQVSPNLWLAINTASWYRVTVTFDASKTDGSVIFPAMQVAINGTNVQSQDAYNQGDYQSWASKAGSHPTTTSSTGTWFRTAINNAAGSGNTATNTQYINNIGFQGSGYVDELQVNANETLTVISAYDTPAPGTTTVNYSNQVTETVTSPVVIGSTQYVCTGASVVGNGYTQNSATNYTLTMTNNATLTWMWGQTNYWLTLATSGAGAGTLSTTSAWYVAGSTPIVTATPTLGSAFTGWTGQTNGCTISGNQITISAMYSGVAVTANFGIAPETLTVSTTQGTPTPGTTTVNYNTGVTETINSPVVDASSVTQYVCTGASVVGNDFTKNSTTSYTLTLTNTASLTWLWQTQYQLTTATNGAGSVTAGGWFNAGSNAVITATPAANNHFVSWSGQTAGCSINGSQITIPMNSAISVTANFSINTETLTYGAGANGSLDGTTPQTVNYGANGSAVRAVPDTGYHFVNWSDSSTANPRTDTGVTNNISVTANFSINPETLTVVSAEGMTSPGSTTVNYNTPVTELITNTPVADASSVTQYVCTGASVVGNDYTQNSATNVSLTLTNAATLTWQWQAQNLLATATNGAGSVTAGGWFNVGSNAVVTATPAANNHFVSWSGQTNGATIDGAQITIPMNNAIAVTANFTIDQKTLTYDAGAHGSLSGTTSQTVDYGTDGSAVTAVPDTGYHFVNWSDSSTANPRTDTDVTNNISVTANFAVNTESLTVSTAHGTAAPGATTADYNTLVTETVDAIVANGTTRYVCTGASVSGNDYTQNNATNVSLTLTNAASLTWQWQTQYQLTTSTSGSGSVTPSGWYNAGSNAVITAAPAANYTLSGWTGDISDSVAAGTTLTVPMSAPRNIQAVFVATPLTWTTNNGTTIIITGSPSVNGSVTIPSTINGLPVTGIGSGAFAGLTGLTAITIPASVTSIAVGAFNDCSNLVSITVDSANPNYSSLNGVLFDKTQESILTYPAGLTGAYSIPGTVVTIGPDAFYDCINLSAVTIPSSVTTIGSEAFYGCAGLATLSLPSAIASLGDYAFSGCPLVRVLFSGNAPAIGTDVFNLGTTLYYAAGASGWTSLGGYTTIPWAQYGDYTCAINGSALTIIGYTGAGGSITIPGTLGGKTVTTIGAWSLAGCTNITNIIVPNTVTSIGVHAFDGCTGLDPVTIANSVTAIGAWAFNGCINLTSVTLPTNLTTIAEGTFCDCYSLVTVTIPEGVTALADDAFINCGNLVSITLPSTLTTLGNDALAGCSSLEYVIFNGSVPPTSNGTDVFAGDTAATIYYPTDATGYSTTYGSSAPVAPVLQNANFIYMDNGDGSCTITRYIGPDANVVIPPQLDGLTVTSIGDYAFVNSIIYYDNSTTNVTMTLPVTITNVGACAFYDCNLIGSLSLPTNLVSIGEWAFAGTYLSGVTIPASVTSIGLGAFTQNSSLTAIAVNAQNANYRSVGGILFDESQTTLLTYPGGATGAYTIPGTVTSIGPWAFGNGSLSSVTVPASVTSIAEGAFVFCSSLTAITVDASNPNYSSLNGVLFDKGQTTLLTYPGGLAASSYTVPSGVTTIGPWAFSASPLVSVTIPSSVLSIGDYIFYYCTNLKTVYFQGNAPTVTAESLPLPTPLMGMYCFCWDPISALYYLPDTTGWDTRLQGELLVAGHTPSIRTIHGQVVPTLPTAKSLAFKPQIAKNSTFGVHPDNTFGFTITSDHDITVVVCACTNLSTHAWVPIATNTFNGTWHFVDMDATNHPGRFYAFAMPQ